MESVNNPDIVLNSTYDLRLVALASAIAVISSYTALDLVGRVTAWRQVSPSADQMRSWWLIAGAGAMGIGIWSMHFVAMLAFYLPVPIGYDVPTVVLSMLISILASGLALLLASRPVLSRQSLLGGSLLIGLAIASMHYLGMAAMRLQATMQYNLQLVSLSLLIAIVASGAAMWLAFQLREETTAANPLAKLGSALVLGTGISGLHYTGIAATTFTFTESGEWNSSPYSLLLSPYSPTCDQYLLATTIGIATTIVLGLALLTSIFDRRIVAQIIRAEARLATLIEGMQVGVLLLEPQGEVILSNPAACNLLGVQASELLGKMAFALDESAIPADSIPIVWAERQLVQQAIASHEPVQNVVLSVYRPLTQDWVWLLVNVKPQRSATGDVEQIVCSFSDISDRKRAEEEIRLLQTMTQAIGEAPDFDAALQVALQQVCEATGWNYGEAWIKYTNNTALELSRGWYASTGEATVLAVNTQCDNTPLHQFRRLSEGLTFVPGVGLPGRVWSSQQPEWIADVSSQSEQVFFRAQMAKDCGLRAEFGVPIIANNQVLAILVFFMFEAREEDKRLVKLVSTVGTQLGSVMQRKQAEAALQKAKEELEIRVEKRTNALSKVNQQLLVEIAERKSAEAALRQSQERFRRLAQQEKLINLLASHIRNSLNLDIILETTVQEIRERLQIDRCGFAWYQPEETTPAWEVVKEAKRPNLPTLIGQYPVEKAGRLAKQLLDLEMLREDDVSAISDLTSQQLLLSLGNQSFLAIPIQTRQGAIGALICSQCSAKRHWEDSEVDLLLAVTAQLAIAIDQADLYAQAQITALVAQEKAQQLQQTLHQLQKTQAQLVHSEKMSSLGQLVAGIAHELNNPLSFIIGNLEPATQYIQDLLHFLLLHQQHYPQPVPAIQQQAEAIDLKFLIADLPKLLVSMHTGADRISQIVLSLRSFSRFDEVGMKRVNLHEGIDNTLLILQHRLKPNGRIPGIEIIKDYGDLPLVECHPGQLNQVFMNILNNAIDALKESAVSTQQLVAANTGHRTPDTGHITIRTECHLNHVTIRIADNGPGMTEAVKPRVFDPFFTTKAVGSGTGLGLSISYQIVVENHQGSLWCVSEPGRGAEFWIELPIQHFIFDR